jgi:ubiquitin C-terminal hydrolase
MGVVHHYGTLNRGHYFANVKVDDIWYECDDEKVSVDKIDSTGNQSKYVYILFYERQK